MKRETLVGMIDEIETRITKHEKKASLLRDERVRLIVNLKSMDDKEKS